MKKILQILLTALLFIGCSHTFRAEAIQMNPAYYTSNKEMLNVSRNLCIVRGGLDLGRFQTVNYAKFVMISRDRIRFHVDFSHTWKDLAKPCNWKSEVFVDNVKYDVQCDSSRVKMFTKTWDEQRRVVQKDQWGDIISVEQFERSPTQLSSLTIFIGKARLDLYQNDILTKSTKEIKLVMKNGNSILVYKWKLVAPEDQVQKDIEDEKQHINEEEEEEKERKQKEKEDLYKKILIH